MLQLLSALRHKVAIGFVGGSDLAKQQEQLGTPQIPVTTLFDFCFSENGLTAYRLGSPLSSQTFIGWLGETKYKELVKFILHYVADLDIPVKRGTFLEFRNGMVNVSPIGRNASVAERNEYQRYDLENKVREKFIEALRKEFPDIGLTYNERNLPGGVDYTTIHFFGDKTFEGGNDYEIYADKRTVGHSVENPEDCYKQLKALFDL
ncbi:hypothetical protein B0A54_12417 [Friedmanniomyces endolithicus]|uniref:Phosphomannomutase n=1 Tax=Friedmanniomyces endolithicus TaxID=329885 RepID=A0A4U0UL46_9PEZI|nr:hypothetical protein B0A54_12417 [Friedmanniomyces endolithicus]